MASSVEVVMHKQILALGSVFLLALSGPSFAASQAGTNSAGHNGTPAPRAVGQPNQSCGSASAPQTPGEALFAPGSAFNPTGMAGTVYAGQQPQNSNNPAAVSQYDVACANQP
jgi:hypothetical protein